MPVSRRSAGGSALRAADALRAVEALGNPADAALARRYFKTAPGEYGAGDVFVGIRAPAMRGLEREYAGMPLDQVLALLRSPVHEARSLALMLLVRHYRRGDAIVRREIFEAYLAHTQWVNNWDLVDGSAPTIVGGQLLDGESALLDRLAASDLLWERRIAILATAAFIRAGRFQETFRVATLLLHDRHDLIHKAVGWMLREVGKRDLPAAERFLLAHYREMPRTMLRYAIERFTPERRRAYLEGSA